MGDTKIRWTKKSWNPVSGCHRISAGCDHCYAFTLAENRRGTPAFPVGFDPRPKPNKLREPYSWREPEMIFVNSMSDLFLANAPWDRDYLDSIFDVMLDCDRHIYQVLTKRPKRMRDYLLGTEGEVVDGAPQQFPTDRGIFLREDGYLARRGLPEVPEHIWPGVTVENDLMTFRADVLRQIPAPVRMISAEPLLEPLHSLNLAGIGWLIVGGESGPGFRPMDHAWARQLRDACLARNVPFFFKQSAAYRTEMGIELDGERWEQYPILERDRLGRGLPI